MNKETEETSQSYQARKKKRNLTDMENWLEEKKENKWIEFPNYDQRAKEINQAILKEERDRQSRIDRAKAEERTWDLMKLCIELLGEDKTWKENEKKRRDLEEKKRSREEIKRKSEEKKLTFKCGFIQKKINTFMKKLPEGEQRKFESEGERKRRKGLKEIKEIMWKRNKQEGEKLLLEDEENERENHRNRKVRREINKY